MIKFSIKNVVSKLKKILKIINNPSGFSITDLVASLPLAVLVFVILILAMSNFITTYEETKLFTQLQDELFQAVETMRYGDTKKNVTDGEGLIGLLTAERVVISPHRTSITIYPVVVTQGLGGESYRAKFYLSDKGELKAESIYGIKPIHPHVLFPSGSKKLGAFQQFRITKLQFIPEKVGSSGKVYLLGIRIKAEVRFRIRAAKQTLEEDLRKNIRSIEYKTSVFLGNV